MTIFKELTHALLLLLECTYSYLITRENSSIAQFLPCLNVIADRSLRYIGKKMVVFEKITNIFVL